MNCSHSASPGIGFSSGSGLQLISFIYVFFLSNIYHGKLHSDSYPIFRLGFLSHIPLSWVQQSSTVCSSIIQFILEDLPLGLHHEREDGCIYAFLLQWAGNIKHCVSHCGCVTIDSCQSCFPGLTAGGKNNLWQKTPHMSEHLPLAFVTVCLADASVCHKAHTEQPLPPHHISCGPAISIRAIVGVQGQVFRWQGEGYRLKAWTE